jgi:hypothetical protein
MRGGDVLSSITVPPLRDMTLSGNLLVILADGVSNVR